jgi:hypothetical protein
MEASEQEDLSQLEFKDYCGGSLTCACGERPKGTKTGWCVSFQTNSIVYKVNDLV